ncbi:MAG: hypothetical protein Q7S22_06285 [Candidatus Micrarchaeota archaeon]|nr:hypothetical protein [Candidatus Micrarchaeota archaeon]
MRTSRIVNRNSFLRTAKVITVALAFALPMIAGIRTTRAQNNEPDFVDPGPKQVGGSIGNNYTLVVDGNLHSIRFNTYFVGNGSIGKQGYLYPANTVVKMDENMDGVLTPAELEKGTTDECGFCAVEAKKLLQEHPNGVKALPIDDALKVIAQKRELKDTGGNVIKIIQADELQESDYSVAFQAIAAEDRAPSENDKPDEIYDILSGPSTSISPYQIMDMNSLTFVGLNIAWDDFTKYTGESYYQDILAVIGARVRVYSPFFVLAEYTYADYSLIYRPISSQLVDVEIRRKNLELGAGIVEDTFAGTFYGHATTGPSWRTNSTNFYRNRFTHDELKGTSTPLLLDASFAGGYNAKFGALCLEGSTNALRPIRALGRVNIPWSFSGEIPTVVAGNVTSYLRLPVQGFPEEAYSPKGTSQVAYIDLITPIPGLQWYSNSLGLYLDGRGGFTSFSVPGSDQTKSVGAAGLRLISGLGNLGILYDFASKTGVITLSFSGSNALSCDNLPIAVGGAAESLLLLNEPLTDETNSLNLRGAYLKKQ